MWSNSTKKHYYEITCEPNHIFIHDVLQRYSFQLTQVIGISATELPKKLHFMQEKPLAEAFTLQNGAALDILTNAGKVRFFKTLNPEHIEWVCRIFTARLALPEVATSLSNIPMPAIPILEPGKRSDFWSRDTRAQRTLRELFEMKSFHNSTVPGFQVLLKSDLDK